ncbi:MAG: metal-sensing transcriptional repressor [Dehalococcoidia bacterium]|nr:metal-sensing transcriptional repressor [Dehalococcoidia bacterium]
MKAETKAKAVLRIKYAQGHLNGILTMVEQEKYCVDLLKQLFAVRKALEKVENVLLEGHLNSCVVEGIQAGRQEEVFKELLEVYGTARR